MRSTITWILPLGLLAGGLTWTLTAERKIMSKQFLNVPGQQKPTGYTQVVTSPPGKMIFISGRGGATADGAMPGDFGSQAKNTFEDLKRCLALAGASFKDVVKINYYVKNASDVAELRGIRTQYRDLEHPPASTLMQSGLVEKEQLLEIEAVAVVSE
jgi:enamine deaminase RidA (YjgF/YER057c/UK114 family)